MQTKMQEQTEPNQTIILQLKAQVYDLFIRRGYLVIEMQQIDTQIQELEKEINLNTGQVSQNTEQTSPILES